MKAKQKVRPATARDWFFAARPATLSLAFAPVIVGTALSVTTNAHGIYHPLRALGCLFLAIFLQLGVNFANDYSDGVRGTDNNRVGPRRLTASKAVRPGVVRAVSLVFFALAGLLGCALVLVSHRWVLLGFGVVAIVAAWFYTGGKKPYGYFGLGEFVAFLFFGLVATVGTTAIQTEIVPSESWITGAALGFFAAAVLLANNIRDRENDARVSKKTLAVLLGNWPSRILFCVLIFLPFVTVWFFVQLYPASGLGFFALLSAIPAAIIVITAKSAQEFVLALKLAALSSLLYALGVAVGIVF